MVIGAHGKALSFRRPNERSRGKSRAVAQLGSALDWGSRGRRFKSCQPDVKALVRVGFSPGLRPVRGWFSAVPLWSPWGGAGWSPVDGQIASTCFPMDKGTEGDQNSCAATRTGAAAHHSPLADGPLRRACMRCPAAERNALACSAAEARCRSSG